MGGVKDLMMDNMDLIPEDTDMVEVKELCNKTYELLDGIKLEIDKIIEMMAKNKLVNKNYGRHKCKIYYMDKEITDDELRYLRRSLTPAQILKDFKYVNIGRKYNGNATKYQCKFIDAMDAKYTNDEDAIIFEHIEKENNITAYNKYDNGVGVITVQMIIQPVYESEEQETKYYYISTQPFKFGSLQAYPVVINEHLFYYLTSIKYNNEEPITSNIDVVYTTTEQYKKLLADSERVLLQKLLAEDLNNIVEYAEALEVTYPDGNLEDSSSSSGGSW